ncbi:hypothetical protein Vadar_002618 [Vaccinium darrowii]|uniref:Uncharacterized protein n=1 Tax=Vaccinium darrowii TaxID=229202 RepID=A0ACB7XN39_9ERIC|nr:hypothetical protein Vadar_002618 [Vaccinium darrowii]
MKSRPSSSEVREASGWYCLAKLQYAALISMGDAFRLTLSTSYRLPAAFLVSTAAWIVDLRGFRPAKDARPSYPSDCNISFNLWLLVVNEKIGYSSCHTIFDWKHHGHGCSSGHSRDIDTPVICTCFARQCTSGWSSNFIYTDDPSQSHSPKAITIASEVSPFHCKNNIISLHIVDPSNSQFSGARHTLAQDKDEWPFLNEL